ncbi:MAG TPA: glycosyltransferase family 4 protein [Acidimicrobiales bacterium]|nr:glycosyltransferase family 4 protein [Acidimicrobiales bacterium]
MSDSKRPARVLLVDSIGYSAMGGAAWVINEILEGADRARHIPVLACLSKGQWPETAREKGIAAYSLPRTRVRSLRNLAEVVQGLRRIIRDESIDLVHASENTALLYSGLATRTTGTRLVWHIHSPLTPRSREERLVARVLPHLRPDHVVFTSPAAQAKTMAFPGVPTSVVFPGVDLEACRSGDAEAGRRAFGIPDGVSVVSMFARVVPEKGAATFVECMGQLAAGHPDLHGILCGPGDARGPFWQRLESMRAGYGLEDRLLLPGDVRPPRKHDVVAMSDVVLHTSHAESFGLAVLEAMAAGKPVVASEVDGPKLLIRPGVDGLLVKAGDTDGFARAVAGLLDDPEERTRLGRAAWAAAEHYPISETVRQTEDLWDTVLASR